MAFLNHWLLTLLILLPVVGAVAVWIARPIAAMRWTALSVAFATCCLSFLTMIPLKWQRSGAYTYDSVGSAQLPRGTEGTPARLNLAIDGFSLPFILLTTLVCCAVCTASLSVSRLPRLYFCLILLFESATLGLLLSFDAMMFYGSLVASLGPAFLLIGIWGGAQRWHAAAIFLVYMLVSSICLGIALWSVHRAGGTFDLVTLANRGIYGPGRGIFLLALVAFLIRLPTFPFHRWLPSVLAEASGPVGAMIGALLPLTGGYGLLRIVLPLFPCATMTCWSSLAGLAVVTILFGSLRAWSEKDLSRSIAYGSISMAGFALLGVAVMTFAGLNGAIFVLISQGLILALMMIVIGRAGSGSIHLTFLGVAWFAEMVIPGLIGVLTVLLGTFEASRTDSVLRQGGRAATGLVYAFAIAASLGMVLLAAHAASALRANYLPAKKTESGSPDLPARDIAFLAPLAAIILLLGIFPASLCFTFSRQAVEAMLKLLGQ
jgi:NADH:ubiquinone oxidoreductase subunit 4 (subunit M)